ncbi:MAG: hypothetical protein WDO13_21295 [Verrucomicrobiota bacterium]
MVSLYRFVLAAALAFALAGAAAPWALAQELVGNGGFEQGAAGWKLVVPGGGQAGQAGHDRFDVVTNSPHSGGHCLRLQSDDFACYGVAAPPFAVRPGEHYRVSAWFRADPAAAMRPDTPDLALAAGFVIRLTLRQGNAQAMGAHLFLSAGDVVTRDTPAAPTTPLPRDWTRIEAVIEMPAGTDNVVAGLFAWWTRGALYADDFTIEKVAAAPKAGALNPPPGTAP